MSSREKQHPTTTPDITTTINPKEFYRLLMENGHTFFTGVPDSLLKNICAYITDNAPSDSHIIAANEGNAVTIAAGYHLATGVVPVVYMQNSGLGNTINPLSSLASTDVYGIPILFMIGWRGVPGINDEPQHKQIGRIQNELLDAIEVPHVELGTTIREANIALQRAQVHFKTSKSPFAILVRKDTFDNYALQSKKQTSYELNREGALRTLLPLLGGDDVVVSTTGMTSRELFELREKRRESHERDFLCVGNMGHTSSVALGVALGQPGKKVWCFDGDGSMLMHMGATAIIGQCHPENFFHIVFNNFAHDSVGGQPTAANTVDFPAVSKACQYSHVFSVSTTKEIERVIAKVKKLKGPVLVEIKCNKGSRSNLGRPTITPLGNKKAFMRFLDST